MKKLILMISLISLSSCKDMDGKLQVFKSFKAQTSQGSETISSGTYETSLNFKKDRIVAQLEKESEEIKMTIKVPRDVNWPDNGAFEVKASQSGQPFDILGTNATDEKRSGTQSSYESCQYQDYQTVCDQYGCRQIVVNRWGHQYIEYYVVTTTQDLAMDIVSIGEPDKKMARFTGRAITSEKVITRKNRCQ